MPKINEAEKKELLSQILNSDDFRESKRYQDLLTYIVEKSESSEPVKEIDIAFDVFGKDSKFDSSTNPLIRSYISNLRKKLEHYYLTTEESHKYKLEIPKGHYKIVYTPVFNQNEFGKISRRWLYFLLPIILILTAILTYQLLFKPANTAPAKKNVASNPIWTELIQSDNYPVTIILGDYLFLIDKNLGPTKRIFVRNPKINNENDFKTYKKLNPGKLDNYEILKYTYLRPSSSLGLAELFKSLGSSLQNVTVKLASEVKWEDFDKHSVIYIGTFKTLYKLDTLIAKTNIRYGVEPSLLNIVDDSGKELKSFGTSWQAGNYQNDYSVLLKIPGYKNNTILFLMGFSEIGVMESVRTALDPKFIPRVEKFLNKKVTQSPLFFEMISSTEGVEMTSFKSAIKYFKLIK